MVHSSVFELLVFDLDGTLIDSREDITDSVNHALKALGLPVLSLDAVTGFVGGGVSNLIRSVLGEENEKFFKRAMRSFRGHYAEHLLDHTMLYPGVVQVLESLPMTKVLITNKPTEYSITLLEGLRARACFSEILGGDSDMPKKPAPDALHRLMEKYGAAPEKTLVIGDSLMDIEMGKEAQVQTCAVLYGFGRRKDLINAEPDYMIENISGLLPLVGVKG